MKITKNQIRVLSHAYLVLTLWGLMIIDNKIKEHGRVSRKQSKIRCAVTMKRFEIKDLVLRSGINLGRSCVINFPLMLKGRL